MHVHRGRYLEFRSEGRVVEMTEVCGCGRVRVTRSTGAESPEWRRMTVGEGLGSARLAVKARVAVAVKAAA